MKSLPIVLVALLFTTGCATDTQLTQLKKDNSVLSAQINTANNDINKLKREKEDLQQEIDYLNEVKSTLGREKEARITQSRATVSEVQEFIRGQVKVLSHFSESEGILDYTGGELIDRSKLSGKSQLLVDLKHPVSADGSIMGGRIYARQAGMVSFCILRPAGSGYVVVWKSKDFSVTGSGAERFAFDTMVSVKSGDIPALFCPGAVPVPFDEGTGKTGVRSGKVKPNSSISNSDLSMSGSRTYSFGIEGLIN